MTVAYSLQASLTSHVHIHTLLCAQANEAYYRALPTDQRLGYHGDLLLAKP
jgi:hypothetical protein